MEIEYNYYEQISSFTEHIFGAVITREWSEADYKRSREHLSEIRQNLKQDRMYLKDSEVNSIKYLTNRWSMAYIRWFEQDKEHNTNQEEIKIRRYINISVQSFFDLLVQFDLIDPSIAFDDQLVSNDEDSFNDNEPDEVDGRFSDPLKIAMLSKLGIIDLIKERVTINGTGIEVAKILVACQLVERRASTIAHYINGMRHERVDSQRVNTMEKAQIYIDNLLSKVIVKNPSD